MPKYVLPAVIMCPVGDTDETREIDLVLGGSEGTHPLQGVEPRLKATRVRAAEGFEPSCHIVYDEPSICMEQLYQKWNSLGP
jgi:hypothetical protein